jgi:hypothetical protein
VTLPNIGVLASSYKVPAAAGLTVTALNEVEAYNGSGGTMTVTSGSISPTAGCLLVAFFSCDVKVNGGVSSSVAAVTDTITDTGGGSWTKRSDSTRTLPILNLQYYQQVEVWTCLIGTSPSSGTVTASLTNNGTTPTSCADLMMWLNVVQITGQHASPIGGATPSTNRVGPGPSTYPIDIGVTPVSTSAIVSVIYNCFDVHQPVLPSGYTELFDQNPTGNGGCARSAYKNGSTTQTFTWGINTADGYNACALEIKAA